MDDITKTSLINEAYNYFKNGNFEESAPVIDKAFSLDHEDNRILTAYRSMKFWSEKEKYLKEIADAETKGDTLLRGWKNFLSFQKKIEVVDERCINVIRQWCFTEALGSYEQIFCDSRGNNPQVLFKMGRCYKSIGDYKNAINFLERTFQQLKQDSTVIAELADCYALINELKLAKLFFREAFFIDPQKIEFVFIESPMINRLIDFLKSKNLSESEIKEWLPVYGVVYGVLNIKRQLKPDELGQLKQSIHSYESRMESDTETMAETAPRLLNYYFRLIDHYTFVREDRGKIDDILRNIEKIDEEIFLKYID